MNSVIQATEKRIGSPTNNQHGLAVLVIMKLIRDGKPKIPERMAHLKARRYARRKKQKVSIHLSNGKNL